MNTTTKKLLKTCTINAEIGTSRYGSPQPQLMVRTPKGTHFRQLRAALLSLAAEAELATPTSEHWIVQIDDAGNEVLCSRLEGFDAVGNGLAGQQVRRPQTHDLLEVRNQHVGSLFGAQAQLVG